MHIALVGTRGVPARYGGFETCVEEVGRRLADRGHRVTVYCRLTAGLPAPDSFAGMTLVQLPAMHRRSLETLSHTALSVGHAVLHRPDVAIVFNAANAPFLPALRAAGIPVATHVDGLEWQRAKWGPVGQRYYRMAEAMAVRWSDALIADAQGIQAYYTAEFQAPTELIAYGAPQISAASDRLGELDLTADQFHLVVARFEPENHVDLIVAGYSASAAALPLVVVGAAPYADAHTRAIHSAADGRVRFTGALWDQELLDSLYAHARSYLHGHSVGGTNPSLLRAIGAAAPTIAFDVTFNREVLGEAGVYFRTATDVARAVEAAERDVEATAARGALGLVRADGYDWDDVADSYERMSQQLRSGDLRRVRGWDRGRRTAGRSRVRRSLA